MTQGVSRSPIAQAIAAAGGDFLMTAKPASHKALYDFMQGATIEERTVTHKLTGKRLSYRWFQKAPLRDGKDAMLVNWIGVIGRSSGNCALRVPA